MSENALSELFASNRAWAKDRTRVDPTFFERLAKQQSPKYLWIGCADSRVPANEIVGLDPGELFVHRNIANVVVHSDMSCLSVLQFGIEILRVEHIMVVGHYGCAGITQTLKGGMLGVADNWLRHIQDVQLRNPHLFDGLAPHAQSDLLVELNALESVRNVCRTSFVRDAWRDGQKLAVHGWVYGLSNGLLKDLGWTADHANNLEADFTAAVAQVVRPYL